MPVANRLTRAQAKAQTREELVHAADRLFTGNGFHATSLDLVAAEAGYTKGAVYSNFGSKEDLFFAVYEQRVERANAGIAEFLEEHADDAPQALARRTLAKSEAGWLAVFFEFWAHVVRNPDLRERFAEIHRRARAAQVEWTRGWMARKGIDWIDPDEWTAAMFAMVSGIGLEQLIEPALDGGEVAGRLFDWMGG